MLAGSGKVTAPSTVPLGRPDKFVVEDLELAVRLNLRPEAETSAVNVCVAGVSCSVLILKFSSLRKELA